VASDALDVFLCHAPSILAVLAGTSPKEIGYNGSYLDRTKGHLVPVWQPFAGASLQQWQRDIHGNLPVAGKKLLATLILCMQRTSRCFWSHCKSHLNPIESLSVCPWASTHLCQPQQRKAVVRQILQIRQVDSLGLIVPSRQHEHVPGIGHPL
jgi:hypothetical protein